MSGEQATAAVATAEAYWRSLGDEALVAAMRAGELHAWDEFHQRYTPLLELYARRIRISPWMANEYVATAMDDAALKLAEGTVAVPRNLGGYLCTVLRNVDRMARRAEMRRVRREQQATTVSYGEHVVRSLCSEHALRASGHAYAPTARDHDDVTLAQRARTALAVALRSRLSDDERRLIAWVEDAVPCREIASWLGISYEAAAKRILRLKARLRLLAAECIGELAPELQPPLHHLFARRP